MTIHIAPLSTRGRLAAFAALAGLAFAFSGLASAQPYGTPPPNSYAPPPPAAADARQDRIEELESQIREATAENERLQFQLMQAEREMTRLRNMVGELADTNNSLSQPPPEPEAPPAPAAGPQPTSTPAPAQRGSLGELPASDLPGDSGAAFRQAQQLLLNNRIAEAEVAFGEFIRVHGDAAEAADARFWFAYTLLARNNFAAARDGYVDFLQRYPRHNRAQEAQVRLGMALAGLGETRMACAAFRDLPAGSARAVRDLAARESRAANCPA